MIPRLANVIYWTANTLAGIAALVAAVGTLFGKGADRFLAALSSK